MSLDAMRWAFQQTGLRSSVKFVLVALADRANEDNECWPSRDVLAADTCMNPETVSKATEELVTLGLLEKRRRFAGSVVFRLIGVQSRHPSAGNPAKGENPIEGKSRHPSAGNPAPNLPINLPKKIKRPSLVVDDLFEQFWLAYPRKVKKPEALKAWRSTAKDRPPLAELLDHLSNRAWPSDPKFIPHPSTFLRGHQWADDLIVIPRAAAGAWR